MKQLIIIVVCLLTISCGKCKFSSGIKTSYNKFIINQIEKRDDTHSTYYYNNGFDEFIDINGRFCVGDTIKFSK